MKWSTSHPEFARYINDVRFTRLSREFVYMIVDFTVKGLAVSRAGAFNRVGVIGGGAHRFAFTFATAQAVWPDDPAWAEIPRAVELRLDLWAHGKLVTHSTDTYVLRALLLVGGNLEALNGEEQARPVVPRGSPPVS